MTGIAPVIMMSLLRATVLLALSALLLRGVIWWLRLSSPTIQRLGWFLVLVQGVMLFHFPVEVVWYAYQAQERSPTEVPRTVLLEETGLATYLQQREPAIAPGPVGGAPVGEPSRRVTSPQIVRSLDWPTVGIIAWLTGMVCVVGLLGIAYGRFLWQLSTSHPGPESWRSEWQRLLADHGVHRSIPLEVTRDLGPVLCWTPRGYRLFVPERLWTELTGGQRRFVLRHELAHFERADLWKTLLVRLLALPHWFNPFAWWAVGRFAECAEWACDQAATGSDPDGATEYAKALLRLGSGQSVSITHATAARGGSLSVRIRRLMSAPLSEDSLMKKATIFALVVGLVVLNVVRVELTAEEIPASQSHEDGSPVAGATPRTDLYGDPLPPREFARLASIYELTMLHMRKWEGNRQHEELVVSIQDELAQEESLGFAWKVRFIPFVGAAEASLTEFEKTGLQRIKNGASEVFESSGAGVARYIRPVRARQSCLAACHSRPQSLLGSGEPKTSPFSEAIAEQPGDILSFISLIIEPSKPQEPKTEDDRNTH
jgi:beta-lactamase regulating signal transducer with metallopeptidase domain